MAEAAAAVGDMDVVVTEAAAAVVATPVATVHPLVEADGKRSQVFLSQRPRFFLRLDTT